MSGTFMDQGTHDELLRPCDSYRTFVVTQLVQTLAPAGAAEPRLADTRTTEP
jgi:hypothetical protein